MIYEYECNNCDYSWEEDQSIKDDLIKVCPNCKNESAKIIITGGSGFLLKGKGWFKDGY